MNTSSRSSAYFLSFVMGLAVLLAAMTSVAAEEKPDKARVVYHADYSDAQRMSAMLTSIFNMVTTYENEFVDYDIRIVFLSHGIQFLTHDRLKGTPFEVSDAQVKIRDDLITRIATLRDMQHVNLSLCEITRQAIGLDKSKLIPGVDMVTSGVVEIAKLQSKGFAYIKVQ